MSSCSDCQLWFLHWLQFFIIFNREYEAAPLWLVRVPHLVGGSILHQGGRCMLAPPPDMEGYLLSSLPSLFGLACHDPVWWLATSILGFTICQHQWALMSLPPPDVHVPFDVYCHIMLPKVFTHLWWMLQQMSMVKAVTSSLSIPGKSCW